MSFSYNILIVGCRWSKPRVYSGWWTSLSIKSFTRWSKSSRVSAISQGSTWIWRCYISSLPLWSAQRWSCYNFCWGKWCKIKSMSWRWNSRMPDCCTTVGLSGPVGNWWRRKVSYCGWSFQISIFQSNQFNISII